MALGAIRSYQGLWRNLFWLALAGAGVLLAVYVGAMVSSDQPGSDDAAGIGVVVLSLPILASVSVLLGVGAGIGSTVALLDRHDHLRR